jgi:hypothetical protein
MEDILVPWGGRLSFLYLNSGPCSKV